MGRRDGNDQEWKDVKARMRERDDNKDRIMRVISALDAAIMRKRAGSLLETLDPAHIYAVSIKPKLCYELDNLVSLNRYSHSCLDDCKHPITGEKISSDEMYEWWKKITGPKQWSRLQKLLEGD